MTNFPPAIRRVAAAAVFTLLKTPTVGAQMVAVAARGGLVEEQAMSSRIDETRDGRRPAMEKATNGQDMSRIIGRKPGTVSTRSCPTTSPPIMQ